jgi:hypothetical protein
MILFDQIVEIFDLPQFHVCRQDTSGFEVSDGFGIRRIFVERPTLEELMERG